MWGFILFEVKNFLISVYLVAFNSFHHFLIMAKKKKMLSQHYNFPLCKIKLVQNTGILLYILRKINFFYFPPSDILLKEKANIIKLDKPRSQANGRKKKII